MQLVILGYHRSGTSAVAQYFYNCGLFIGDELMEGNESNTEGHFEDMDVFRINQSILQYNDENWLLNNVFNPVYSDHLFNTILKFVAARNACHNVWGFKEPRTCLFVDLWDLALNDPVYIIPLRHYTKCVDSIQRRAFNDCANTDSQNIKTMCEKQFKDPDRICRSWATHMISVLNILERKPEKCFVFDVDEYDKSKSLAAEINKRFSTKLDEKPMSATFKNELFQSHMNAAPHISPEFTAFADKVWNRLYSYVEV